MACAACLVVAATLPAAGSAAEHVKNENLRLAAFTDVAAFSAIPSYLAFLGGDLDRGSPANRFGYDGAERLDVFFGTA